MKTINIVAKEEIKEELLSGMKRAAKSLQEEGKKVAFILWDDMIVATVGYTVVLE